MFPRILFYLFISSLFFCGCNRLSDNIELIDKISIDLRFPDKFADVSEFMSLVQIKISRNDFLVYPIVLNKAFSTEEHILILDYEVAQAVFCYDISGELLWHKKFGKKDDPFGPISVSDIYVYDDKTVELYDDMQSTFFYHDIYDGSYKGKEYVDFDFNNKIQVKDSLFVFTKFGIESQAKYDTFDLFFIAGDQLTKGAISYDSRLNERALYEAQFELVKSKSHLIYTRPFSNVLYNIKGDKVEKIASLHFIGHQDGKELYENYMINNTMMYVLQNNLPFVFGAGRFEDLYFLLSQTSSNRLLTIHDINTRSVIANSSVLKFNDTNTIIPNVFGNDNKMYSLSTVNTDKLIDMMLHGEVDTELKNTLSNYNNNEDESDIIINIISFK